MGFGERMSEMSDLNNRQKEFQRNNALELLLKDINALLAVAEDEIIDGFNAPKYPFLLVVGAPRCGSTIMMQWLATTGIFAYPTNLISRFYRCPAIGAKLQLLLTDARYNYNNELFDLNPKINFDSQLGKTRGALAPNEFWYFWRRFLPTIELQYIRDDQLSSVDTSSLLAELAAIEAVFDKPLAMKGHMLELNIPFFADALPRSTYLFIKRSPFYNIQSLLQARMKYYGNINEWYSVKPREYLDLIDLSPVEQVAAQVYLTNQSIEAGLSDVDDKRKIEISYEKFCESPQVVFERIRKRYYESGVETNWDYRGPAEFKSTNQIHISDKDAYEIIDAYARISGEQIVI